MERKNPFYTSVYLDCDSTLVDIEGLDELANFYRKKTEVSGLTEKSMSGEVKLEDVFALKLAMIKPHRNDFDRLGNLYVKHVVEDARETVAVLHYLKKTVVIMSGNFYPAVIYLSRYLGIPDQHVYANQIHFAKDGSYLTFDSHGPLSIAGGKRSLMLILKRDELKVVFVGDGSTDMETKPPVDLFIGYGGVVQREKVKSSSDVYLTCRSLAAILPFIITQKEYRLIMSSKFRHLLEKGENLVNQGYAYLQI